MVENVIQNNGFLIALSGIAVVFCGLVLIAIVIHLFNKVLDRQSKPVLDATGAAEIPVKKPKGKPVPEDHIAAITVALEIYHKLYYDALESKVTFIRGDQKTQWKAGYKFGLRFQRSR